MHLHLVSPTPTRTLQVGVRFDTVMPGGTNLGQACEDGHGFFCSTLDLRPEGGTGGAGGRDEEVRGGRGGVWTSGQRGGWRGGGAGPQVNAPFA